MSASVSQIQNKMKIACQEMVKVKEEMEMRLATPMRKVRIWISNGLATQHPAKLVGMALGAVLLAGTALYFTPSQVDEAAGFPAYVAATGTEDVFGRVYRPRGGRI